VTWGAVANATGYEVWRSSMNGAYAMVGTTTTATSIDDSLNVDPGTTYLYKVRAVAGSAHSAYSAIDLATTIVFTDTTLTGVAIKAVHITQLQTAVNAVRAAAGLSAVAFPDVTQPANRTIRASHIKDLRDALDEARDHNHLDLPAVPYTDPTITAGVTKPKPEHITDLRGGVQ